jgi:kinesin family protein 1
MDEGTKARTVASTQMNATSSRAHTLFTIMLTQTKVDKEAGKAMDKVAPPSLSALSGIASDQSIPNPP